jgi:photosystem II stability/assembly factor-like uncharacterized protein
MKNFVKILIASFFLLILSGCSLTNPMASTVSTPSKIGSILKSTDGGKTWTVKNKTEAKADIANLDILSIAINPYDSNNVFFGARTGGIIKTNDGGETLLQTNFISEKVYGLALSPYDGRVLYASGVWQKRGKIFKSPDGGENWSEIYTTASEGPLVISLTIDKVVPNIIYATTSDSQVLKSVDAGGSWKNIFSAPSPVVQVAIDSENNNLVYFNTQSSGIFRSRAAGLNPENITKQISGTAFGNSNFKFIETDPTRSGWVYATGQVGILRSKDGGNRWERINVLDDPQKFPVTSLAINFKNPLEIIYGAAKSVYRSGDEGNNWTPFQIESNRSQVKVLKYSVLDSNIIFAGMGD